MQQKCINYRHSSTKFYLQILKFMYFLRSFNTFLRRPVITVHFSCLYYKLVYDEIFNGFAIKKLLREIKILETYPTVENENVILYSIKF